MPTSRRKFLSSASAFLGVSLLEKVGFSSRAEAQTWQKLQTGPSVAGVYAWGDNTYGQLGNGAVANQTAPVKVCSLGRDVISVAASPAHSLALLADGRVMAWGHNDAGQLGNNTTLNQCTPVVVCGISTAVAIAAGRWSSYALLANGSLVSWGCNQSGQLGDGTSWTGTDKSTPVAVCGISTAIQIISGGTNSAHALLSNGNLFSWGSNGGGVLGNNSITNVCVPAQVCNISTAVSVAFGRAVLVNGTVMAWGYSCCHALGDGTSVDKSTPVAIAGISNAVAIASGSTDYLRVNTLVLTGNGSLMGWGRNSNGALGDGTTTCKSTPVAVMTGISTAVAISISNMSSMVLLQDGSLRKSGSNVGYGLTCEQCTPVTVSGITAAYGTAAAAKRSPRRMPAQMLEASCCTAIFLHKG